MPQDNTQDQKPSTTSPRNGEQKTGSAGGASGAGGDFDKTKDALVEGAHQLTDGLKSAAGDAAEQAKKAAESKLDAGRDFAAEHLGSVAHALRKTGDELGKTDSALTGYVGQAASAVEDVSSYLQTRTLSQLFGDLESFARREPAVFLGGSFIAGIFGGRFLKSATPQKKPRGNQGASYGTYGAGGQLPALPAYTGGGNGGSSNVRSSQRSTTSGAGSYGSSSSYGGTSGASAGSSSSPSGASYGATSGGSFAATAGTSATRNPSPSEKPSTTSSVTTSQPSTPKSSSEATTTSFSGDVPASSAQPKAGGSLGNHDKTSNVGTR